MSVMLKDPGSRIDYRFDWDAAYLDGQAIALSAWTVEPVETGGIVVDAHAFDTLRTSATLSGGRAGVTYRVTNRVTLTDGQIDERSLILRAEQR
jgi:hypothetical protein